MEYAELIPELRENINSAMAATTLYLSIITGYLIVAHTAAKTFSGFQLGLITFLFLAFSSFFGYGTYSLFLRAHGLQMQWGEATYSGIFAVYGTWIGLAQMLGIVGSLFFMYQAKIK
jgi:hypothetical protein